MSRFRGYEIESANGQLVFSDTGLPTAETWLSRPCGHCKRFNTPEGHDGCIGILEGVSNACCGHGQDELAYVQFESRVTIRGSEAISYIQQNSC